MEADVVVKLITVNEFMAFLEHPENDDKLFELIHGEIVEKVPTEEHGIATGNIITDLKIYLRQNKIGRAGVEILYRVPDDEHNARQPDISLRLNTDSSVIKKGAVPGMPDIAIEIKSPTNTIKHLREKADYYLANGTQIVWLVFPEKKMVEVYETGKDVQIFLEADTLDGGDLLPGFKLAVKTIFEV